MGQTSSTPKYIEDYRNKVTNDLSLTYQRIEHIDPSYFLPHANKWDFSFNFLTSVPQEITQLLNLTCLDLSYNDIEQFPLPICDVPSLRYLNLSCNMIAQMPRQIERLQNLNEFYFSYNRLEALPDQIGELRNLSSLSITNNFLTEIPNTISNLSNLKSLNFKSNHINHIPESLFTLGELKVLVLSNNEIMDLSPSLARLRGLNRLSMSQNKITSFPPEHLDHEMPHLSEIKLNGNKNLQQLNKSFLFFNKVVNLNLKNCPNLRYFPNEFFIRLPNLEGLDICYNDKIQFTDDRPLPRDLKLKKIAISVNMLSIPFLEANKEHVSCKNKSRYDEELLKEHVSHLVNLKVWSGGYECGSVEEEIKKTLLTMTPIRNRLWLSSRYGSQNRPELMANGITHILMVGSELTPFYPDEFEYFSIQVKDVSSCDLSVYFGACHKFIEIGRKKGGVLVHCAAGVSRSATVIMAYLMWSENMTFAAARKEVTALRPIVKSNFFKQLERYSKALRAKESSKGHKAKADSKTLALAKIEVK